jgi:hypothetical protein
VSFPDALDPRLFVSIGPSGGRPTLFMIDWHTLDAIDLAEVNAVGAVARFIVHTVIFRGGWTVHVDAPDRDPVKIRCRNRAEAEERGRRILIDAGVGAPAEPDPETTTG